VAPLDLAANTVQRTSTKQSARRRGSMIRIVQIVRRAEGVFHVNGIADRGQGLMQNFSGFPDELVGSAWRHRNLIKTLAIREVVGRYRGSLFGLVWSIFNPVLMLGVYTFVFSVVFKARWPGGSDSQLEFALILFAGLTVFNLFAECVTRAPSIVLSNANYVKKVIFPLEIFPWVALCSAFFHFLVSMAVWLLFYLLVVGLPHPTIVFFPLTLVPLVLFTMGLSWFLASLGVFYRDVGQVIGIVIPVSMFMSPIFYPISALPEAYRSILFLNPIAVVVDLARAVLIWGSSPDWLTLVSLTIFSGAIACLGFAWFQKTRRGFADVL
jgi:lipopolysaccharide transport system permease protein